MEIKKTQQLTKPVNTSVKEVTSTQTTQSGSWRDFLGNIKEEFGKISWTSAEELRTYTKMVVGATFIFGMGIYLMDIIIQLVLSSLNFVMRLIGG